MAVWVHDDRERVRDQVLAVLQAAAEIDAASAEISLALALAQPIRIGAGVNTGHVILGGADYTALGDAVNVAFRLEAATKTVGAGMLVGESAFDQLELRDLSAFERCQIQLKGYETASTAWSISFQCLRQFIASAPR
jgi:adenylate cyclase